MGEAVRIAAAGDHFVRAGGPWFYLADTVWSAFTGPTAEEWTRYLDVRAEQGFNALQINVLPQWDRSRGAGPEPQPFAGRGDGGYDWSRPNPEYFDRARSLLAAATARGFVPALVALWCDSVPGTWAAARVPAGAPGHTIARQEIEPWCRFLAETFGEFGPVLIVSGDTDLARPETRAAYLAALQALNRALPDALTAFHLSPDTDLPEELVERSELDFYMYQSGHDADRQDRARLLARRFLEKPVRRPVVNGEPCYEGHGHARGRFEASDVRRAIWQSLLAGAKAGVAYGAHGVWCWHRPGASFPSTASSGDPYPWDEALSFPGAWDAGYARWIFERFGLVDLEPVPAPAADPAVRFAASPAGDTAAAYLPAPAELPLPWALDGFDCVLIDLAQRRYLRPRLQSREGRAVLGMSSAAADSLLLATRTW